MGPGADAEMARAANRQAAVAEREMDLRERRAPPPARQPDGEGADPHHVVLDDDAYEQRAGAIPAMIRGGYAGDPRVRYILRMYVHKDIMRQRSAEIGSRFASMLMQYKSRGGYRLWNEPRIRDRHEREMDPANIINGIFANPARWAFEAMSTDGHVRKYLARMTTQDMLGAYWQPAPGADPPPMEDRMRIMFETVKHQVGDVYNAAGYLNNAAFDAFRQHLANVYAARDETMDHMEAVAETGLTDMAIGAVQLAWTDAGGYGEGSSPILMMIDGTITTATQMRLARAAGLHMQRSSAELLVGDRAWYDQKTSAYASSQLTRQYSAAIEALAAQLYEAGLGGRPVASERPAGGSGLELAVAQAEWNATMALFDE